MQPLSQKTAAPVFYYHADEQIVQGLVKRKPNVSIHVSQLVETCLHSSGNHEREVSTGLASWLTETLVTKDLIQGARLSFGSGVTYFARAAGHSKWNELPKTLQDQIDGGVGKSKDCEDIPMSVTFGANGAWFAQWKNHCKWDFAGQYKDLEVHLGTGRDTRNVKVRLSSSIAIRLQHTGLPNSKVSAAPHTEHKA